MQSLSETTKPADVEACAREVLDSSPPIQWFIRRNMRSHRGGLSMAQFRSLIRANRPPAASLSDVAEHLGASLPTTSRIVQGLVDKGLLSRQGCRWDRRQITLELTAKGRDMLQTARKATQESMEAELAKLTPQQRQSVIKVMRMLRELFWPPTLPPANSNGAGKTTLKRTSRRTATVE
ncbi:MAG TPA: MarR family transcriptional regulator [Tepidisphaeraceae bacterium]|nr:MarR family transcriptional regulator [Tepidisphaeraceae bacterium]